MILLLAPCLSDFGVSVVGCCTVIVLFDVSKASCIAIWLCRSICVGDDASKRGVPTQPQLIV